jgi:hypothetical protein
MDVLNILQENKHHEGKILFIGCKEFTVAESIFEAVNSGKYPKKDFSFYINKSKKGWQSYYDLTLSIQNNLKLKADLNRVEDTLEINHSDSEDISVLILEGFKVPQVVEIYNSIKLSIKSSVLIVVTADEIQNTNFKDRLNSEFNTQHVVHLDKFSYIEVVKDVIPIKVHRKISRSNSVLT